MATETTLAIPSVGQGTQGNIDVAQVTNNSIPSANVLRENVVAADPVNFVGQAQVTNARGLMVDDQRADLLQEVLIELRLVSQLLAIGLNINDDLELLRADSANLQRLQQ